MNTAANTNGFLAELFGSDTRTEAERAADFASFIATERAAHAASIAADAARLAAAAAERAANACPKCAGRGYLPQFQHRNGGECFACGATGVFTRYAT